MVNPNWRWSFHGLNILSCFLTLHFLGTNNACPLFLTETKYSSLARTDLGSQKDAFSNGMPNGRTEMGNHQAPVNNGVPKTFGLPTAKTSQMVTTTVVASNNDFPKIPVLPGEKDIKTKTENKM